MADIEDVKAYTMDHVEVETLKQRFTYHVPHGGQPERYEYLRDKAFGLALDFLRCCPTSRELSLALTKLEESVMWANAAIARNEGE